jgi:acetyl esterase/lipase
MIRKMLAGAAMLAFAGVAMAQTPAAQPAAPAQQQPQRPPQRAPTAEELANVTIIRDQVYGHKDGMALVYDVFKPKNANGAMVVNMISGSWFSRWTDPNNRVVGYQPLLTKGFTVVALHHGSAPKYLVPEAAADIQRAMRDIKAKAAGWGVDPNRIGVWGASAGGHLSLVAGLQADDGDPNATDPVLKGGNKVKAIVAYYPPTDMRLFIPFKNSTRAPGLNYDDSLAESISPALHVDAKDPPVLIITGDADKTVDVKNSHILDAALTKAGVEHKLVIFPGADHGFVLDDKAKQEAYQKSASEQMVAWFVDHLNK